MSFESFMVLLAWSSILIFLAVAIYKIVRIVVMPLNVRWEVYPIPHEHGERRHYGGSYMEEVDWAKKPRPSGGLLAELLEIGYEVVYLKKVKQHNRYGLWPLSLAMHWGIYLMLIWLFLLVLDGVLQNWLHLTALSLSWPAMIIGVPAFLLGAFGSLALGLKRASDKELSRYTAPIDYCNLLFLLAIFDLGIISWLADPSFAQSRAYVVGVLTFQPAAISGAVAAHFLLLELFFIYMPFSKLIHYIAKYFTFHSALWDDGFKVKGSKTDQEVMKQLSYVVSWAGPHVVSGKTWLEEVQMSALEEKR